MATVTRCEVWWLRLGAVKATVSWLDGDERRRLSQLHADADRARFAAGASLVRAVAGRALALAPEAVVLRRDCATCGEPHGKPWVDVAGAPYVSVSHSGDHVAVAVATAPVGVDVEAGALMTGAGEVGADVLAEDELAHARDEASFLRYWVRKEAVVKATGDGLLVDLRGVRVTPPADAPALLSYATRPGLTVAIRDLAAPGGVPAAVAVVGARQVVVAERDGAALVARCLAAAS